MNKTEKNLFNKLTKNYTRQEKQKLIHEIESALSGDDQSKIDNISNDDMIIIVKILKKRLESIQTDLDYYQNLYNDIYC